MTVKNPCRSKIDNKDTRSFIFNSIKEEATYSKKAREIFGKMGETLKSYLGNRQDLCDVEIIFLLSELTAESNAIRSFMKLMQEKWDTNTIKTVEMPRLDTLGVAFKEMERFTNEMLEKMKKIVEKWEKDHPGESFF